MKCLNPLIAAFAVTPATVRTPAGRDLIPSAHSWAAENGTLHVAGPQGAFQFLPKTWIWPPALDPLVLQLLRNFRVFPADRLASHLPPNQVCKKSISGEEREMLHFK